jgi:uncharacterized peroxidase-related enzyme
MSYIPLEKHLPGITGLLEYRQDTGVPIRELTQILLRGESTLTEAERELIATVVSSRNECRFCTAVHTAEVNVLLEEDSTSEAVKQNIDTAPVSDKLKSLLHIAASVQKSGKTVTSDQIDEARRQGATDREIHDTVLIAALFSLYNRYVDGLSTMTPEDPAFYNGLGQRLKLHGYNRLPQGYDHLRTKDNTLTAI